MNSENSNSPELLKRWRQELGYTQMDLAEILGVSNFHICDQERNREPTTTRTINHLALIYAIHSLPPDAPVLIIQEMLVPPNVIRKRQKAMHLLKARRYQKRQKARKQA